MRAFAVAWLSVNEALDSRSRLLRRLGMIFDDNLRKHSAVAIICRVSLSSAALDEDRFDVQRAAPRPTTIQPDPPRRAWTQQMTDGEAHPPSA